jgi:hypothetical protein
MRRTQLLQKKFSRMSPAMAKAVFVSLVASVSVGAIVFVAHEATPVNAAPAARPIVTASTASTAPATPVPSGAAKKTSLSKGQASSPVTITGCLEQNHDAFRLTDTSGAEAPRSRSWKTGFLTKHASSVAVVDGTRKLKLGSHVGERVSVTGTLVDKEMQGKTLRRVTESCD